MAWAAPLGRFIGMLATELGGGSGTGPKPGADSGLAKVPVVATGGLAPVFADDCDFDRVDFDLTLEGLRLIHLRNTERGGR